MAPPPVDLSVVIPARNVRHVIGAQLDALAAQAWDGSWEVVVADNGSSDGTAEHVMAWVDRLPSLRVVDASGRPGISHARNAGCRAARGRSVVFVDADDLVRPGWLPEIGAALAAHPFVAGALVPVAGGVPAGGVVTGLEEPARPAPLASAGFLDAAPGCNLGVRLDVWREVGGFREDMLSGEDTAFCWDVQLAGHPLTRAPGAVIEYALRDDLRGLARQRYHWGKGVPQLYAEFRGRGAPRSSTLGALARWAALLLTSPVALVSPARRRPWVARAADRAGRLVGSVRHRVVCL